MRGGCTAVRDRHPIVAGGTSTCGTGTPCVVAAQQSATGTPSLLVAPRPAARVPHAWWLHSSPRQAPHRCWWHLDLRHGYPMRGGCTAVRDRHPIAAGGTSTC